MAVDSRLVAILQHWYWDPAPEHLKLDQAQLEKWATVQKRFADKQATLELEKIEALEKLAGKKIG